MAYLINADIESRLGSAAYVQLTDDAGTGVAVTARVDEARLAAEGEVNSYLSARHAVPVDVAAHTELAAVLRSISLDLAEHRLHARRPPVPPDVVRRRGEAIAWLAAVAAGTIHLPATTPIASDTSRAPLAEIIGPDRIFTRD